MSCSDCGCIVWYRKSQQFPQWSEMKQPWVNRHLKPAGARMGHLLHARPQTSVLWDQSRVKKDRSHRFHQKIDCLVYLRASTENSIILEFRDHMCSCFPVMILMKQGGLFGGTACMFSSHPTRTDCNETRSTKQRTSKRQIFWITAWSHRPRHIHIHINLFGRHVTPCGLVRDSVPDS